MTQAAPAEASAGAEGSFTLLCLVMMGQFLRNSLFAVPACGRKPFADTEPPCGLSEIAMISTWDISVRQRTQKPTGSQAASLKGQSCTVLAGS